MLPPSALDRMPDAFVALWQGVEDEILKDIARRIAKTGTLTETAKWQLWRYQQTEALRSDVVKLLAKYSGKSDTAIRQLLLQAATEAMEREDAIYYHYGLEPTPFEESAALNNLLDAGARQTAGTWKNLTATTANTVTGQFERTLDAAWARCLRLQNRRQTGCGQPCRRHEVRHLPNRPQGQHRGGRTAGHPDRRQPDRRQAAGGPRRRDGG